MLLLSRCYYAGFIAQGRKLTLCMCSDYTFSYNRGVCTKGCSLQFDDRIKSKGDRDMKKLKRLEDWKEKEQKRVENAKLARV